MGQRMGVSVLAAYGQATDMTTGPSSYMSINKQTSPQSYSFISPGTVPGSRNMDNYV